MTRIEAKPATWSSKVLRRLNSRPQAEEVTFNERQRTSWTRTDRERLFRRVGRVSEAQYSLSRGWPTRHENSTVGEAGTLDWGRTRGCDASAVRHAVADGVTANEMEHVAVLAITTLGLPAATRGLTWIKDPVTSNSDPGEEVA